MKAFAGVLLFMLQPVVESVFFAVGTGTAAWAYSMLWNPKIARPTGQTYLTAILFGFV